MTSRAIKTIVGDCGALLLVACVITAGMTGCGATSSTITPPNPPPAPANITGNWELAASATPGATTSIAVYLTSSSGVVSGIANGPAVVDNVCANGCCGSPIGIFKSVALSGAVDSDGKLKLGTAAGATPDFAMTGTASGSTLSNGSFTLTGTCSAQGTITGTEYAPLDGIYAGTLTSQATGQSYAVTTTLDQSDVPDSSGYLNLTGEVSVSGYPCFSSGALPISSTFLGNVFNAGVNPSPNSTLGWSGILSPGGKTIEIDYGFNQSGNSCNDDYGTGTLTLQ